MRTENNYAAQQEANNNASTENQTTPESAFQYLKSLPPNYDNKVLESYKKGRESQIVDYMIAEDFTDGFRGTTTPFSIPVSWNMTKAALIKLLGITSYDGYDEVNGIRFYAGLNGDNQLTLVAVSTQAGTGCSDDLTVEDSYPYYDYAEPCPTDCSNRGNLRVTGLATMMKVAIVTEK
jgi:hypothetical protein